MFRGIVDGRDGDLCSSVWGEQPYVPYRLLEKRLVFGDVDQNMLSSPSVYSSHGCNSVRVSTPIGAEVVKAAEGGGGKVSPRAWILFFGRLQKYEIS